MQAAAVASAAAPLVGCLGSISPWRRLSDGQARTLAAICERIIPADQDPGATWAGVVTYIDRQLAGPFREWRKIYRLGLAGADGTSRAMFGNAFVALTARQQDAVLQSLDEGRAPGECWQEVSAPEFFDLVVTHTMEGFYGDPRHGGNRDRVSWKMLRLPYPPVRGRQ